VSENLIALNSLLHMDNFALAFNLDLSWIAMLRVKNEDVLKSSQIISYVEIKLNLSIVCYKILLYT